MKKILIALSVFLGLFIAVLIVGLLSISSIITPDFIVSQIESSLNVRANVSKVNINLISILSSVELEELSIYNRDSFADNAKKLVERTPVVNPIISVKNVELKLSILPLLRGNFVLNKFVLYDSFLSIVVKENGNNLSHLFRKPKIIEGKPNSEIEKDAESKVADNENKPFTAKSIPVSANIGKVGLENATIDIFIQKTLQKVSLKNVSLLLSDIDINPRELEKHNSIRLTANLNASILNAGGQETALFKLNSNANIVPFIPTTGLVNPSMDYHLTIKESSYFDGLSIMDALSGSLPILANAGIKMEGLSKKAVLNRNVNLDINYNSGKVTFLTESNFPTANFDLTLEKGSWIDIDTNNHTFTGGILASKSESEKATSQIDLVIKEKLKINNPEETRNKILSNILKVDRINLPFVSTGNIKSPNVQLGITLPSIFDMAKDIMVEKLKDGLNKNVPSGVNDSLNKGLKKLF